MSTTLTEAIRPLVVFQGITSLTGGGAGKLDGIATLNLTPGLSGFIVSAQNVYFYQLTAGTEAEDSPLVIRPDDYAGATNEKYWKLLAFQVDAGVTGMLTAAANLSDLANAATARTNLGLGDAAVLDAGVAGGVASLDVSGKVPMAQLPGAVAGAVSYQGVWNASTNTPDIAASSPEKGFYYKVSVAGSTSLSGIAEWNVGDFAIYNGATWDKIDNTEEDATDTVKGRLKLAGDLAGTADSPAIAANAATDTKIGSRTADDTLGGASSTGTLTQLLSWLAGAIKGITGKASWLTAPRTTLENAVKLNGDTMTGDLTVSARLTADKWANTQSAIAYAANAAIDFSEGSARSIDLTGNWTPTTANRSAGRMVKIKIKADASPRTTNWPAWVPITPLPATIPANKSAVLTLECWGANDSDITAACSVEA